MFMPSLRNTSAATSLIALIAGRSVGTRNTNFLAVVAGGREIPFHLREVARAVQHLHAGIVGEGEVGLKMPTPVLHMDVILAGHRGHHVGLAEGTEKGTADSGIVERRIQMVEAQHCLVAKRVDDIDRHVGILAQQRQQVGGRLFPPVDLAGLHRRGGGGGIGDGVPLDAVEIGDLRAGGADRRAIGARHIIGVALIDRERAGTRSLMTNL